ncbi:MAG: Ig-like domain-containing protein, partial [Chloroflexota bacterium]
NCPRELVEVQPFQVVPPELLGWARDRGIPEPPAEVCSAHGPSSSTVSSQEPSLTITSPTHGAVLQISPEIPASVQKLEFSAVGIGLPSAARVELWVNDLLLGSFQEAPYRFTWQLSPGNHTFRAIAKDAAGNILTTGEASILVQ